MEKQTLIKIRNLENGKESFKWFSKRQFEKLDEDKFKQISYTLEDYKNGK